MGKYLRKLSVRMMMMSTTKSDEPLSKIETVQLRKKYIGEACQLFFHDDPIKITRAKGQFMYDENGVRYLDCINNVAHVGHCNDTVVKACCEQMAKLNTNSRFLHDTIILTAKKLVSTMPDPLSVCFFVNSGTEANDLALRIARAHTKGVDVICLDSAYHGNSIALIDISPYKFKEGKFPKKDWVHVAPIPDTYRGKYCGKGDGFAEKYAKEVQLIIDDIQSKGRCLSTFIAESALSCAGQIMLPANYLKLVYSMVHKAGGVCIADEVQTGFGRFGKCWWGFQSQDVVPDIVTVGKAMGNGFPVSAVITTKELAESFKDDGIEFFNTFGGNPVSCAASLAVIEAIENEKLMENALKVGDYLMNGLSKLSEQYSFIGDIRGSGFFIGIELVTNRKSKTPATVIAKHVLTRMKEERILLSTDGPHRNVLKIKPPMVFSVKDADKLLNTLDLIFTEVQKSFMSDVIYS